MKNKFFLICSIWLALLLNTVKLEKFNNDIDNISDTDIEKILYNYLGEKDEASSPFIPIKEKKNKNIEKEKEEENSPIANHRRKNGDQTELISSKSDLKSQQTCSTSQFKIEPNVIIDSKVSLQKGAKLVSVEHIGKETAQQGLNKLQESCMKKCCESETCDSALISMRIGIDGYRCYLFSCNQNCLYVRHSDYIVMRIKSPEQMDHVKETNVITTGHKDSKTPCHKQYEFTCSISKKCIPIYDVCNSFDDCDDKTDELNCTNSRVITPAFKLSSTKKTIITTTSKLENDLNKDDAIIEEILNDNIDKQAKNEIKDYNGDGDYDTYELARQAEIVDYLNQLIDEKKTKVIHKSPIDIFDSFMRTSEIKETSKFKSTTSKSTTKKTTTKYIFHDGNDLNSNDEKFVLNLAQDDKIYFQNKEISNTSTGDIVIAILLLVIGISLVIAFFSYLILSTKYMSKRITWLRKLNMKHKNVDVDPTVEADYLINGMYL